MALQSGRSSKLRALVLVLGAASLFVACSDDEGSDDGADASAGSSGFAGAAGTSGGSAGGGAGGTGASGGSAGTGGSAATGGSAGTGGAAGSGGVSGTGGGGTGGGTADGGQPIGSLCVNDQNCNQSQGKTVCCAMPGCVAPCECQLETNCPGGTPFLPCQTSADCSKFGGGKVCCEVQTGGSTMRFCTKQNGCSGQVIP
jgi:hypothetical protein